MSSSSLALTNISAVSSLDTNFSARPLMYSALRCESPAVRRVGRSLVRTWAGDGKAGWVSGKSAVNFLRIEAAAWPDTWRMLAVAHITLFAYRSNAVRRRIQ
jgi:hypothetical protein